MIQILKDSFSFYKFSFFNILKIYLPILIIQIGFSIIFSLFPESQIIKLINYTIGLIIGSIHFSALIFLFSDILNGNQISPKVCLLNGFIMVPLVLYTDCLSLLIIIIGLLFLIIPGLFLAAKLSLQSFCLLLLGNKPTKAIKNSYTMTKGHTKNIIGCFALVSIPYFIFFIALPLIIEIKFEVIYLLFPFGILSDLYSIFFVVLLFRFYCLIYKKESDA